MDNQKALGLSLVTALQAQYTRERQNGAVYDALAGAFEKMNLAGFAAFMARAANEERGHAKAFFDWLADIGEQPQTAALEAVSVALTGNLFSDALRLFEFALESERQNKIALETVNALAEQDPATEAFLFPIHLEQVRSIRDWSQRVTEMTLAQSDSAAFLALNEKLGEVK